MGKGAGCGQFSDHFSAPHPRCVNIGNGVFGHLELFIRRVKNGRAIAHADIIALPVDCGRVVNLEEKFE